MMTKEFNITGTCIPKMYYMVDTSGKPVEIFELIERGKYFTINRPRQYGKTTTQFLPDKELKKNHEKSLNKKIRKTDYEQIVCSTYANWKPRRHNP